MKDLYASIHLLQDLSDPEWRAIYTICFPLLGASAVLALSGQLVRLCGNVNLLEGTASSLLQAKGLTPSAA